MSEEILNEEVSEIDTEEQARIEHENFLKSFPATTVFYDRILEEGNVKRLGAWIKDPYMAERLKMLEYHMDESELSWCINPKTNSGSWYLKGHEPEETPESIHEKIMQKIHMIDKQLEQYMDDVVSQKDYMNVVSCISYYNSTDEVFRTQARAVLRWRDEIYQVGRDVRDKVLAGELDWTIIDMDYILDRVEPLDW